jgi:hypothetical protein
MESRNVRMNAAIEGDWRITGRSRGDPNKAATRISEEPSFTYVVAGERQDYVDWLRKDSYPLGYQGSNALQLADQCTADNELISDVGTPGSVGSRIAQHADKRNEHLNRVEHSGQLRMEGFNIGLAPGLGVELRGAHTLPMRSVIQTVVFSAVDQTTTIDLAAPDNARIYDGPSIVASAEPASEADKPQKATESKAQESGYDESGYGDTEKLKTRQMPETFEQETKSGPLMNRPRPGERSRETKGETDEETRGKARGKEVTTDDARKKKWGKEWKDGKLVDRKPQGLDSDVQRKRAKEREARAAEQAAYDKHIKEGGRPGDFSEAYQQRKSQYDAVHKKHEKYRSKKAAADEAQDERRRNLPRTDPKAYRARMAGVEEPAEKKAASRRRLPEDVMPDELTDERRY